MRLSPVALAVAALTLSASASAAHLDDTALPQAAGMELKAPQQHGGWSFFGDLLWQENNNSGLNYLLTDSTPANGVTEHELHRLGLGSDFGYRVAVTYNFAGNGRDATLEWTDLDNSPEESVVAAGAGTYNIPGSGISISSVDAVNVIAYSDSEYRNVDLVFGQKINVGRRVSLHPFAGLRYTDIDVTDGADYTDFVASVAGDRYSSEFVSSFEGIGPRLGADAMVHLGKGFSFVSRMGVSAIVGEVDGSSTFTDSSATNPTDNYTLPTETRVVPELDARVAIRYDIKGFTDKSSIGFELGYDAVNHFGALAKESADSLSGDSHSGGDDFAVQGPYLKFSLELA